MNRLVSWICKIFFEPIVKFLFIKEIKGWENIPKKNFILVSNHQSHLDWMVQGYVCVPRRFHFIGQTDQYTGLFKILLYITYFIAGVIGINRKKIESKRKAMEQAIEFLKKGDSLIIYPEGGRSYDGKIKKGKHGVARIFLKTGTPILPMAVKGTFELLPPKSKPKISTIRRIIEFNIGKPLYFEKEYEQAKKLNEGSEQYRLLLSKITDIMMEKIVFLKAELDKNS
ncbi:MAG: 1-acyl-sn-glycerol-3-phosphate acyltransferase [Patescibacteria group bacterium]|nr:1-acyl-sn-glycerol-3-phosphate acyltransferase [Patescibacteria group bacterium]